MAKIGILGAGTWGMALTRMLANEGHETMVWSALPREIDEYSATRRQPNLPGMIIPDSVHFTKEIEEVCTGKDILLFAVPSVFVRSTTRTAARFIPEGQIIVDVAKGIEPKSLLTMTEVIADELGDRKVRLVALSGPTHAEEVAKDLPTTIVAASKDEEAAGDDESAQDEAAGPYELLGIWDGFDAHTGLPGRNITPLSQVDGEDIMLYDVVYSETLDEKADYISSTETKLTKDSRIDEGMLPEGEYLVRFVIRDVFNNTYYSEYITVNWDGETISY